MDLWFPGLYIPQLFLTISNYSSSVLLIVLYGDPIIVTTFSSLLPTLFGNSITNGIPFKTQKS